MSISQSDLNKLKNIPILKQLKKIYDENPQVQGGAGRRMKMRGGSKFWEDVGKWIKQAAVDVDAWSKKVKPLTALSKAAGLIGMIPGLQEVALLSPAIMGVANLTGYGKKYNLLPPRGFVGMGKSKIKGGKFNIHLQRGTGVSLAIGSIGNAGKIKF